MRIPTFNKTVFDSFKSRRGMEFLELNMAIFVSDRHGKVVGTRGDNLVIAFDDGDTAEKNPFWQTSYYDKSGNLIKKY